MKPNFYYECHDCKKLVDGHFETNSTDLVKMVPEGKPNNWVFECQECYKEE